MRLIRASVSTALLLAIAACATSRGPAHIMSPDLLTGARGLHYEHNATLFTVTNGMTGALLAEPNTNLVKIDVRYRFGSGSDPAGKAGLAHLVEHMTYELRPDGPDAPTLKAQLSARSLYYNAYTNSDETHYYAVGTADQVNELVALEAKRVAGTCEQLDAATFERERAVVRNEIAQRASPSARAGLALLEGLYGAEHPYGHGPGGTDASVAAMTLADVCAFMDAHYQPNRVVVVVTGNVDPATLQKTIGRAFGPVPSPTPVVTRVPPPQSRKETTVTLPVDEHTAFIAFPVPAYASAAATSERLLRELLEDEIRSLAKKEDAITTAYVTQAGSPRLPFAVVAVSAAEEADLDRIVDLTFKRIGGLAKAVHKGVRAGKTGYFALQLAHRLNATRASLIAAVDPLLRRGNVYADYMQYSGHKQFIVKDLERLHEFGADDVLAAAQKYYRREDARVVYIRPGNDDATSQRATLAFAGDESDLEDWHIPVDETEADRPIPFTDGKWKPDVREAEFSNGMRLLFVPNMASPLVDIRVVFPAGSLHEPEAMPGLASMAAFMLSHDFSRKYFLEDSQAIEFVQSMGGTIVTNVDSVSTTFRIVGLNNFADGLLWKLHWLLQSGVYSGGGLKNLAKWAARSDTAKDKAARAREVAIDEAVYGRGHPYARSHEPLESIATMTPEHLRAFKRTHYRARGATLIVTGKFDDGVIRERARRLWGSWRSHPGAEPPRVPAAAQRTQTAFLAVENDDAQVSVQVRIALPPGYEAAPARWVIRDILTERMSALREKLGATYGVHVSVSSRRGPGELMISGSFNRDKAGIAYAALIAVLEDVRSGEGLAAEFVRARRKILQTVLAETADSASVAGELETTARLGVGIDYYDRIAHRIAALTLSDARAIMATDLAFERAVVIARGDRSAIEAMYAAAGATGVRWLD